MQTAEVEQTPDANFGCGLPDSAASIMESFFFLFSLCPVQRRDQHLIGYAILLGHMPDLDSDNVISDSILVVSHRLHCSDQS